jgi:hypothetical protein
VFSIDRLLLTLTGGGSGKKRLGLFWQVVLAGSAFLFFLVYKQSQGINLQAQNAIIQ